MASRTITRVEYTSNRVGKTRKSVFFGTVLVALVVAALNTPLSLRGNYYALGQPSADFNHMIVFTRWHDGMPEVFVMNNDGTGQRGFGSSWTLTHLVAARRQDSILQERQFLYYQF